MEPPNIGDTAHIKASVKSIHADAYGVVARVRAGRSGAWTAVELLIDGQRHWIDRAAIDYILKDRNPFASDPARRRGPCRLFCILARDAATGVIFRRGPSRWVQLIKWNTATDTFEPGQWFHG